jgi:uncharacterized protein with HEPN domain
VTKDRRVYLAHILECTQKIERFTVEGKARFVQDDMVHDAVIRNFEIIGKRNAEGRPAIARAYARLT